MNDCACNTFVCFGSDGLLKAEPAEEGGRRLIYFEASNEGVDQQGERVLSKALRDSSEHYLKFGNLDIDHYSLIGRKMGIPNPHAYEIGRPVEVKVDDRRTFVKAELYRGDGDLAANANMVWDSLTKIAPPARWYPSVGGSVLAKSTQIDPDTNDKVTVVERVRWTNVALSRTPVNQHLGTVDTVPMGVFSKSLNALVLKTLEAGYGTDSATLTGGGALRTQSLHGAPMTYFEFEDALSGHLLQIKNKRPLLSRDSNLRPAKLLKAIADFSASEFGLGPDEAVEMVERFFMNLERRSRK